MHPQIRQHEPGKCPICGMDLIPVSHEDAFEGGGDDGGRVVLSARARALAKMRTTPVRRQANVAGQLRLLGRFEPNETTFKSITAWTGGRIDRLLVNFTGERVRVGQVIATLYSPEVFAAHQDLILAKRQMERTSAPAGAERLSSPESAASSASGASAASAARGAGQGTARRAAAAALDAARERLRLLGVPDDALARMEGDERPTREVMIRTPFAGTVIERLATEGAYVTTGTPLYRVANLKTLWVQLDAYESDLSHLLVGQDVKIGVDAWPGETFEGKVTFIDPTINPVRRTAQVRVQVDNPDGRLRPGMFAEATVAAKGADDDPTPLVVPASAPLFTGRRALVYVEVQDDQDVAYEPRTVRLGPRLGEVYPVVAGLSEGERVVTRGAFALDADLQIRGGHSMMSSGDDEDESPWDGVVTLASDEKRQLVPVVEAYLAVQAALAADELTRAKAEAERLASATSRVRIARSKMGASVWSEIAKALHDHARQVATATNLEGAREGFEPLSGALIVLLARFGNPIDRAVRLAFCPMASGSDGAFWVQRGADIDNAYFGAMMRTCGEIREEVAPGRFLKLPDDFVARISFRGGSSSGSSGSNASNAFGKSGKSGKSGKGGSL